MSLSKRMLIISTIVILAVTMSGCVKYGNKNVDDMTQEEKQKLDEVKEELSDDLSDSESAKDFALWIIDKVEKGIDIN